MNFQFEIQKPIQESVKDIAGQLIEGAISVCKSENLNQHEIIHSVRKSCKRIRGLLRIVRPNLDSVYKEENNFFRDLGRTLSKARDRQVLIELLEYYGKITPQIPHTTNIKILIENFEHKIANRKDRIKNWEIKFDGFESLKGGIKKTYSRGKKAMQVAHTSPTPENYHEWRKRVKYHYYHLELLTQIWPAVMDTYVEQAHRLSEMLGNDHDFCLLKDNILSNNKLNIGKDVQSQILSTIDTEQLNLRLKINALGQKVYAELPKHLLKRLEGYWNSNILHQIN